MADIAGKQSLKKSTYFLSWENVFGVAIFKIPKTFQSEEFKTVFIKKK